MRGLSAWTWLYGARVFDEVLALAPVPDRETDLLRTAARQRGLRTLDLRPGWWDAPADPRAAHLLWRVPTGAAALSAWRGRPLPLAVAPPSWTVHLPASRLQRRLALASASDVLQDRLPFAAAALKPAVLKVRGLPAQPVAGTAHAQQVLEAARVAPETELVVADAWLSFDSEYRVFCAGRRVLCVSPYLVQDEAWSPHLPRHRASFHDDAAAFAAALLEELPPGEAPPACAVDVGRLDDGTFAVVEVNTAWAAGLYGCDPQAVLEAVLAAQNSPSRWAFRPGPPPLTP